jgi:peptidoglycan/xylan/chitin deacetylase (PgdA/CDA1 family)
MKVTKVFYKFLSYSLGFLTAQRGNLRILMYHHLQSLPENKAYLPVDYFEEHMAYLANNGYKAYTLKDVWESWPGILDEPKTVVLTFDDAWVSHKTDVLPILKKYNFVGVFFVPTSHIKQERYRPPFSIFADSDTELCNWDDIKALEDSGMEIGGHTHTHRLMTGLSTEEIREELNISSKILSEYIQKPIVSFCYPFGKKKTFNSDIVKMVGEQGYKIACTTIWGCPARASNLLTLPRIAIGSNDNLYRFKRKLKGRYDFLRWIDKWR